MLHVNNRNHGASKLMACIHTSVSADIEIKYTYIPPDGRSSGGGGGT